MGRAARLAKEQDRALDSLKDVLPGGRFYLAGGGAVGWHLGHRRSHDLDFFSRDDGVDLAAVRRSLTHRAVGGRIVSASEASLHLDVGGVAVDIVRYPYPLLEAPEPGPHGYPIARLRDLAAMKLATIAGRGLRRDFWDLYEILRAGLSIDDAARAYLKRFGIGEPDLYHVTRALAYFADAEQEQTLPEGLSTRKWTLIKAFFLREAPKLLHAPPLSKRGKPRSR